MGLNGILTKYGLLSVISTTSGAGGGENHNKLFFQKICLGKVLQLAVNNTTLWWEMGKVAMNGISIWGLLKVRYEDAAKLEPLCNLFRGNIWSLNMVVNGSLIGFVDLFQGFSILQK